jgi:hypothetical protein
MRHQENIKNAGHSIVRRVNLGARNAPNASRKCQEDLFKPSRICRGKVSLPRQGEEALIIDAGKCLSSKMKRRGSLPVANTLQSVQEFEMIFSSLTSPFDNYSLFGCMSKRGQETDYSRQEIVKRRYLFRLARIHFSNKLWLWFQY